MSRTTRTRPRAQACCKRLLTNAIWPLLLSSPAWAQTAAPAAAPTDTAVHAEAAASALPAATPPLMSALTLKTAFEAAWQRQPEASSLPARRDAATARRALAESWTADAPALTLASKTGQFSGSAQGTREYEIGVSAPLWLPGERSRSGALAEAEAEALAAHTQAARLRTAGAVREAYWAWQRACVEQGLAGERLANTQRLAASVVRRVQAGDLARADQHQADAAVAAAEQAQAEATGALAGAALQLDALIGPPPGTGAPAADTMACAAMPDTATRTEPAPTAVLSEPGEQHPALAALLARASVARRAAELARSQSRANPELTLATTRGRGSSAEPYQQTVTLALRLPFGSATRQQSTTATAEAEALEAEQLLAQERARLRAELAAARQRVEAARAGLAAAERRAHLARETLGFFDKSFRLGETDLPTRLRVELESVEAERQATLLRIGLAAAISQWRQAGGLLPE